MKYIHQNLGHRECGDIVKVTLTGNAANVRLMDNTNYSKYKSNQRYEFFGGLYKYSPVPLEIPRSGSWHVVIDMSGLRGNVRASASVLPS